jgi:anti-sigma-K factor RskA
MPKQTDCETLRDLLPAYSIGATDPEETALVESLLDSCPEVIDELKDYQSLSRALLFTTPDAQPPAALHDRLMAAAQPHSAPPQSASTQPMSAQPNGIAPDFGTPVKRSRVNHWLAFAAVAAAALLLVSNVYWISRVNDYQQKQAEIVTLLTQQRDLLAAAGAGSVNRVELVSTKSDGVEATVLYSPSGELGLLYSDQFPALSPDRTYQLWLIQGEQPVSAGLFQVDDDGRSVLLFRSSEPIDSYDAIAVSTEPASGSELPTTAPVAVGTLA